MKNNIKRVFLQIDGSNFYHRLKELKFKKLLNFDYPSLEIRVSCSSGTYIRSLAHDIGATLGTGAYLKKLERTKIGEHELKDAIELDKINQDNWTEFLK